MHSDSTPDDQTSDMCKIHSLEYPSTEFGRCDGAGYLIPDTGF